MASVEDSNALLIYQVGPVRCCAPTDPIEQIVPPPHLTHPPGSDAARPGIFKHGEHIVSVVDLRQRFGIEPAQWQPGRLVITALKRGYTAFWVDRIVDVVSTPTRGWSELPAHLPRDAFSHTLMHDDHIHLYTEFEQLPNLHPAGFLRAYLAHLDNNATPDEPKPSPDEHQADHLDTEPVAKSSPPPAAPDAVSPAPATATTPDPAPAPTPAATTAQKSVASSERKPTAESPAKTTSTPPRKTRPPAAPAEKRPAPPVQRATGRAETPAPAGQQQHVSPFTPSPSATAPRPAAAAPPSVASRSAPPGAGEPRHEPPGQTTPNRPDSRAESAPGRVWPGVLLILLLLAGAVGGYVYLDAGEPPLLTSSPATRTPEPIEQAWTPPPEAPPATAPVTTAGDESLARETEAPGDELNEQPAAEPDPAPDPVPRDSSATPPYRASIERDEQGITLILEAPADVLSEPTVPPPELPPLLAENPLANIGDDTAPAVPEKGAAAPEPEPDPEPEPVAKPEPAAPSKREILHIVKRGDTLWDIAKRYVNDPWRYPELAENSEIRNPDLIYPGDRVRIIIYRGRRP